MKMLKKFEKQQQTYVHNLKKKNYDFKGPGHVA